MTACSTVREMDHARVEASGAGTTSSVELTVQAGVDAGVDVRFTASRDRPRDLETAAERSLTLTGSALPEPLRSRLAVEAGEVRALLRGRTDRPLFSAAYRLARCRGVVLAHESSAEPGSFRSPWSGITEADRLDGGLPVILGPSAALALVSYCLEVTGRHVEDRENSEISGLTVTDTSRSPYPPQHHPFTSDGEDAPERVLVDAGRWCDRAEHAGDDVDPLFFLLTRPERALRPLAAATHFNRRNLAVECSGRAPAPTPAVSIDSWRVRVGPRRGRVPFHAEVSYVASKRERLAVLPAVALELDPWEVLFRVRGAAGPVAVAVDEDPIEGDSYGTAPSLVTDLVLADFLTPST